MIPAYVASPRLEGVASHVTPIDVIGTDPVRLETNDEAVQQAGSSSFFGYPQTYGTDQDCGPPHALGAGAPAKRLQPRRIAYCSSSRKCAAPGPKREASPSS